MMTVEKPIVPFVSESDEEERKLWEDALPEVLSAFAHIKPFEQLTEQEKTAAKVAIVANPDPAKVASLPNLLWVQSLWAGVERLTADLPLDGPEIVRLTDPQMAETMSEAVLSWVLYLHRDMPAYALQQKQRIWQPHTLKLPSEQTVSVLGLGKLGKSSALRLAANGFNVLGWSRTEKAIDGIACHHGTDGLQTVLSSADILVLLMPLTAETKGMIGARELSSCPKGIKIINFARGPILEETALLNALQTDHVGHAVLDVFNVEPLPDNSPLWRDDKVTVLPHISAPTITSTACKIVATNLKRFFETGNIPQSVDRTRGY